MKFAAPAKINLALHVTGQRADGYHLIETLVTFASVGDVVSIESSDQDRLTFSGPFGRTLAADFGTNLIIDALGALRGHAQQRRCPPVAIHLVKNLPIASGIGGGSADAAAALKALNEFWGLGFGETELMRIGLTLGADVPMCVVGRPLVARGIGDKIELVEELPELHMLLVNPGVGVSTADIFKGLVNKENDALPSISPLAGKMSRSDRGGRLAPKVAQSFGAEARELADVPPSSGATRVPRLESQIVDCPSGSVGPLVDLPAGDAGRSKLPALVDYLATTRNDLEAPARALCPVIDKVLASLEDSGALFARMSGSGATCFGIYADFVALDRAKTELAKARPGWWVA